MLIFNADWRFWHQNWVLEQLAKVWAELLQEAEHRQDLHEPFTMWLN